MARSLRKVNKKFIESRHGISTIFPSRIIQKQKEFWNFFESKEIRKETFIFRRSEIKSFIFQTRKDGHLFSEIYNKIEKFRTVNSVNFHKFSIFILRLQQLLLIDFNS